MKKVGIKVLKPFSYRGKMRKVGETFGVNETFANAMFLLKKAEKFEKTPKVVAQTQKRTYNTTRSKPTINASVKADDLLTTDLKAEEKTETLEKADD